jgi:hypothetical protein
MEVDAHSIVNSPPCTLEVSNEVNEQVSRLTASTRNKDVFPAFCKPIMVMSSSVALLAGTQWLASFGLAYPMSPSNGSRSCAGGGWTMGARTWLQISPEDSPEQSQEPVIDGLEESCHVAL